MRRKFIKMQGALNDYIYFDCFNSEIKNPNELSIILSDRHKSIGGDGIVLIMRSDTCDVRMRMFNADGTEGNMCGNAIRCLSKYSYENKLVNKDIIKVETKSGIKTCYLNIVSGIVKTVKVDMGPYIKDSKLIPVNFNKDYVVDEPISIDNKIYNITCISMGNPHCIMLVDELNELDIKHLATSLVETKMFPEGVNTEFVKYVNKHEVYMRVYERGSGETLACGTGSCATVAALVLLGLADINTDVTVHLLGGDLTINVNNERVLMEGPCEYAFFGEVDINED